MAGARQVQEFRSTYMTGIHVTVYNTGQQVQDSHKYNNHRSGVNMTGGR